MESEASKAGRNAGALRVLNVISTSSPGCSEAAQDFDPRHAGFPIWRDHFVIPLNRERGQGFAIARAGLPKTASWKRTVVDAQTMFLVKSISKTTNAE